MNPLSEERYDDDWKEANPSSNLFVMKRYGARVPFDRKKIKTAIRKANASVSSDAEKLDEKTIDKISLGIQNDALAAGRDLSVEEIQDRVENAIMNEGKNSLARNYITYRYKHNTDREMSDLEKNISGIVDIKVGPNGQVTNGNEAVMQENSNKNPIVVSVQRDYMAGELSRDMTKKRIMSPRVREAHDLGLIHVHDTDYEIQRMHNCCLINLEDMLQNGTEISGTHIDPPKSFATASTVASQIIAQVASSQYGFKLVA